jgi:hypothetical protein
MYKSPFLSVALFLYMGARLPVAAQMTAVASFSPERVETGDTFTLKILVSGTNVTPGVVRFHAWNQHFPRENILRTSAWRRSGNQWAQEYTVIAFDSLRTELPPLYVPSHLGDSVKTNAVSIHVFPTTASADLSDMAPLRDILREPVNWTDYWLEMLAGLLLLGTGYWFWRRRRPKMQPVAAQVPAPVPETSAPALPPREIALEKLRQLEQQALWEKGDQYAHFTAISLIVREFAEAHFQFPALESTTTEIMQFMAKTPRSPAQQATLQELLSRADSVKYAQTQPSAQVCREAVTKARQWINQS